MLTDYSLNISLVLPEVGKLTGEVSCVLVCSFKFQDI